MVLICSTCGTINQDSDTVCERCGSSLVKTPSPMTVIVGPGNPKPAGIGPNTPSATTPRPRGIHPPFVPGSDQSRTSSSPGPSIRLRGPPPRTNPGGSSGTTTSEQKKQEGSNQDIGKNPQAGSTDPIVGISPARAFFQTGNQPQGGEQRPIARGPVNITAPVEKPALQPIPVTSPDPSFSTIRPLRPISPGETSSRQSQGLDSRGGPIPISGSQHSQGQRPPQTTPAQNNEPRAWSPGENQIPQSSAQVPPRPQEYPRPEQRIQEPSQIHEQGKAIEENACASTTKIQDMMTGALQALSKELGIKSTPQKSTAPKNGLDEIVVEDVQPQTMNEILMRLPEIDPYIEASSLVKRDGTILASAISRRMSDTLFATVGSTLGRIGEDMINAVESGEMKYVALHGSTGILYLAPVLQDILLVILTSPRSKSGIVNVAVHKVRGLLKQYLGMN